MRDKFYKIHMEERGYHILFIRYIIHNIIHIPTWANVGLRKDNYMHLCIHMCTLVYFFESLLYEIS